MLHKLHKQKQKVQTAVFSKLPNVYNKRVPFHR